LIYNFGQKPFKYTPPEGFKTLCLANLDRPTKAAVRPDKYFKTLTYAGNGATNTPITGLGFKPDLVWVKGRTATENSNIADSVRGAPKYLISSATSAEQDYAGKGIISFDSDGFTVFDENTGGYGVSHPSRNYVAWCWKAGGAAVENTDGSITSQVSANRDSGFSIVSYTGNATTGATIGHGLGVKPKWMIVRQRDNTSHWAVYTETEGAGRHLLLNNTNAAANSSAGYYFTAEPTSTVFTVGSNGGVNANGGDMLAYCFAEVEGYSKFGSYTGNGNADGPFIHLGFRPAWVMVKATTFTNIYTNWLIWDSARDSYNPANKPLWASSADQESTNGVGGVEPNVLLCDINSNGFKIRTGNQICNSSGQTYIYMAFAEAPSNNLFGGQANAR